MEIVVDDLGVLDSIKFKIDLIVWKYVLFSSSNTKALQCLK